jgi:hypothetical protein
MTMEERKAKMRQLRAKLVRPVLSLSHDYRLLTTVKQNSGRLRSRTVLL